MIKRHLEEKVIAALSQFRSVFVSGARQVGKTTLISQIAKKIGAKYFSFDDPELRETVSVAPKQFLESQKKPIVLDEIQKAPFLIDYLKIIIDKENKPGLFLLIGSSNIFSNPKIYESLAGRMVMLKLYPFATSELRKRKTNLIDCLFEENLIEAFADCQQVDKEDFLSELLLGRFPEIVLSKTKDNYLWFQTYINSRIQKDIKDLTERNLHKIEILPKLMFLLAAQSSSLLNVSNIANSLKISYQTTKNYINFLKSLYIIELLQPYYKNFGKQVLKTPKVYFVDTGLVSHLLKLSKEKFDIFHNYFGYVLENYIYLELTKEASFSNKNYSLFFYRDAYKNEVDFVIERQDGQLVGVEVKAGDKIQPQQIKGFTSFIKTFNSQIKNLVVFYGGDSVNIKKISDRLIYFLPYTLV